MLLTKLNITAHRGLRGVSFQDLQALSLFVGPNNSGKSSILEAVALILRPFDPAQWVQVARNRDLDVDFVDAIWSIFPGGRILVLEDGPQQSESMEFRGHVAGASRALEARATATADWGPDGGATVRVAARVDDNVHNMVFGGGGKAEYGPGVVSHRCFTVTPITHRSGKALVEHLSHVVDAGERELALALLQIFDPHVESIDVSGGRRETVVVKHSARGVVDLASFGDGMRRVVALSLALTRARGGALLVDELEAGIHPGILDGVVQKLLSAAAEADVQVVATTHSLEAVDAVVSATQLLGTDVAGFYLRDDTVRRYDAERLASLRSAGVDLR